MFKCFKSIMIIASCLALFSGCAFQGVKSMGAVSLADGSAVDYQMFQDTDLMGMDVKGVDRYHTASVFDERTKKFAPKTVLIRGSEGFTEGMGKQIVTRLPGQLIQAGEIIGGAYLLGPTGDTVNVGGTSVKVNAKATGGKATATATGGKATNTNTNVNTNINSNKAEGGQGGGGGQGGQGNNGVGSQGNNGQACGGGAAGNPGGNN